MHSHALTSSNANAHAKTNTTTWIRCIIAATMLASALLFGPAEAGAARAVVSWAPHLDRKLVPTRSVAMGRQLATWYGPGLYGNRTGCGSRLAPDTWGIAHRTLPCGTLVTLMHNGRRVSVRVIDRGPYSGATVDLTERTKQFLQYVSGDVRMTEIRKYRLLPER